ncbi:AzlD domain-containing protein [Methanolobus sp. ZRKC3]|uniref:branched-chain amino acid transporter permease n=1 Tax=Methanolobus sp. ZRKC3 TaxID=3125786 RepID=UPI0032524C66
MLNDNIVTITLIATLVTVFTRALPFLFFRNRSQPAFLSVVERDFPAMIMLLLVIYSLKDISLWSAPFGIPEALCITVVASLHMWKRNALLSILAGTVLYMYFIQPGVTSIS